MSSVTIYRHIAALYTGETDIKDAAIVVNNNAIEWVGDDSKLPSSFLSATSKTVDCKGLVIIPGFINTHHHMYQSLTRGVAIDSPLFNWLEALYPVWGRMKSEDAYYGSKLSMAELILSGCTTSSDHHYIFPNNVTLDDTIKAAKDIGLRFHPTRGFMTLGKSSGGLPPDELVETTAGALDDAVRLIDTYHDSKPLSMIRIGIAPCSPFSVDKEAMIEAATLAKKYPAVMLHTHLAENDQDIAFSLAKYGCRPGEYLTQCGWDFDRTWLAHCVKLDAKEIAQFAANGCGVSHCPASNARLASGIAPVREMVDAGVKVGFGVDGSASNDSGSLLETARWALLLQRARICDVKGMGVREALQLASFGGAKVLGRETDLGKIQPGFAADFIGWKITGNVSMSGALDPVAAIMLTTPGNVTMSVINGRVVVEEGKLLTCDLDDLVAEHSKRSRDLQEGNLSTFKKPKATASEEAALTASDTRKLVENNVINQTLSTTSNPEDRPIRPAPCEGAFAPEFAPNNEGITIVTDHQPLAPPPPAQNPIVKPSRPAMMPMLFGRRGTDSEVPIPIRETPMIVKNKDMRQNGGTGRRRSSLGLRGKRSSSSSSGLCAPPHTIIEPSEYYRHINADSSDPVRMRQLLLWCAAKAKQNVEEEANPEVARVFEAVMDDVIAGLTDKSINTSWYHRKNDSDEDEGQTAAKLPNPKNEQATLALARYQEGIQKFSSEEQAWVSLLNEQSTLHAQAVDQYPEVESIPYNEELLSSLTEDVQLFANAYLQPSAADDFSEQIKRNLQQLRLNIHHLQHMVSQTSVEYTKKLRDCEALFAQILQAYTEQEAQSRANIEPMEVLRLLAASAPST
ncbi:hypothetical protein SmJEL517_g00736 [Synchytrium microbalum]|uniref:Amidohydrolase-related domain-containing protein n=1 Tax=Synchytrium microbalum TaxID=1806994 RepID=A0A507C9E6_9FUNG|nr:uncharacterized protein SmJEL517_g00736 [Synchytrium microbalum]TPX37697.1 hypothetical protein SmJEL517_g00736 [Synchytrium microbalum]